MVRRESRGVGEGNEKVEGGMKKGRREEDGMKGSVGSVRLARFEQNITTDEGGLGWAGWAGWVAW